MTGAATRVAVLDDYQSVAASMVDWAGLLPGVHVTYFRDHVSDAELLVDLLEPFEVVVAMRERTPFPRAVLERLPNLRLLVTTGLRNVVIDVAAAREHGIVVSGTRSHSWGTSELTWALILGLVRNVAADDARIRAGGWQQTVSADLDGKILGVVGLGRLGTRVAQVGQAFGMDVVAWSPHLTQERVAGTGVRLVAKRELFEQADVVTLHMVLSDRTRGLVGDVELRAMRASALLVNTSRAALVDQDALARALTEGWIAGAGLDVYEVEPLPPQHWLRSAPNTVLTPHVGYVTTRGYRLFFGDVADDIAGFLAGNPLRVLEP
jgi:phosphoglycerate dehydrogenase-like enzyme